jgi:acetate kinase
MTASIGGHSAPIRPALCAKLSSPGVKLDAQANTFGGSRISGTDSGASVRVISPPTRN